MKKCNFIQKVLTLCCISGLPLFGFALRPEWVGNTPHAQNDTYTFVEVISYGNDVSAARMNAIHELALNKELASSTMVNVESGLLTHSESHLDSKGKELYTADESFDVKVEIKGQNYEVQAKKIDEYVEKYRHDEVKLYTLFMVALTDKPKYDDAYLTDSYGIGPAFMSLIPGVGQWYKGSKAKGALMFAGAAASVSGIILFENQRAVYHKKMLEQPKFAKEYETKANNNAIGRNVCIGIAAGVWIYSLVDAAVAPGAKRLVLGKKFKNHISVLPAVSSESAGIMLALTF